MTTTTCCNSIQEHCESKDKDDGSERRLDTEEKISSAFVIKANYDQKDEDNGDGKRMVNMQVLLEASKLWWRGENEIITNLVHRTRCH